MKALSILLVATPLIGFTAEADGPQLRADVVCHLGKLDSGSSCKSNATKPGVPPERKGTMICGFPGEVSEITWSFIEQREGKDVYEFTRRFPLKPEHTARQTRRVEFAGKSVTVFEDGNQVIVIQSPKQ